MAIPFFHAFRSTNRGRGPKYTVPCPKGRPRRTRRQGEDAERRRAQKDISGPAVHADGGTGGRHSPLLSDGGMVGQRRPGDVYKMRLQIGVHNGAFCCSGTLMKRRKFNGGKRCRLAFHAVDRGSNPLGDAKEIKPLREIVRAFLLWGKSAPPDAPQILKNFPTKNQGADICIVTSYEVCNMIISYALTVINLLQGPCGQHPQGCYKS